MKKILLSISLFSAGTFFAQQQIGNSNFEEWENVGNDTEEPLNWNSFKSGEGSLANLSAKQVERSTSIRSGASGSYCARIWSRSVLGVVANGNMTVGRINMGSSTASSPNNYNSTKIGEENFSEALTSRPDSLVFWVKYTPVNGSSKARVHAILHDNYAFRDPIDANSQPHTVARAELNYNSTAGSWVRKSVPFVYSGPAETVEYILISFSTNETPGGGSGNDEVLIDDVQLIYNSVSIAELNNKWWVSYNENGVNLHGIEAPFTVTNVAGQKVNPKSILPSGIYVVNVNGSTQKLLVP